MSSLTGSAPLVSAIHLQAFLSASAMLLLTGLLTWCVLWRVPLHSWRLRSWLVGAVLLQGLMMVRSPIHLGLIETEDRAAVTSIANLPQMPVASGVGAIADRETGMKEVAPALAGKERRWEWTSTVSRIDWQLVMVGLWILVTMCLVVTVGRRYLRLLRLIEDLPQAPRAWQEQWASLQKSESKRSHAIQTDTALSRGSRRSVGPCDMLVSTTAGPLMVRRRSGYSLIVPESYWRNLTSSQRRGVMLHELAHLQRHDVWRLLVARAIATLHWFNPLAWWALRQYELATECACDQRVVDEGERAAAGFASALVDLVQWREECVGQDAPRTQQQMTQNHLDRGVGFQSMAAPPLHVRVSRLIKPRTREDSSMKKFLLALFAAAVLCGSLIQIRLTNAQDRQAAETSDSLQVMDDDTAKLLGDIASQLDVDDPTTERLQSLMETPTGKIALAGYLNSLAGRSREEARSEAIPRFVDHHFTRRDDGKLFAKPGAAAALKRWNAQAERLSQQITDMRKVTDEIASRMDTSTEAGGLFKRLLQDPQAPVAVLMSELDGGDVISRYLSEALDRMMVDRGDGTFTIVPSKRGEAEKQIAQFEHAVVIAKRLERELGHLALEYAGDDENHQMLIRYFKKPLTATVAALMMAEQVSSPSVAAEQLSEQFEAVSIDTPDGLKIQKQEAWDQIKEIFARVDRASSILPRTREKLAEISETLASDDPLTMRLAKQMNELPLAVQLAAELPYAEADAGAELKALLANVLTESSQGYAVRSDREPEVAQKARELLQVCRRVRRYCGDVDDLLADVGDRDIVKNLGDAGRYTLLNEIRRFAEQHQPSPLALMRTDLLQSTDEDQLRVREDRREIVRRLIEQSEQVRKEAAKDDF